jgi:hypothetical protein
MNQDPLAHQIAAQLSLSLNPSSYQNMDSNTFSRISLAAAQIYEGLYGENYRAVYVEKTRVGCGHSKVGVLVFEGFLRVSSWCGFSGYEIMFGVRHGTEVDEMAFLRHGRCLSRVRI